jgi:peptidyl-prolyl cis-trans isomerase B (cyclophilin B)
MRLRPLGPITGPVGGAIGVALVLLLSGCVAHGAGPTVVTNPPPPATSAAAPPTAQCAWPFATDQATQSPVGVGMDAPLTPPLTVPAAGTSTLTLSTNRGAIVIQIDRAVTPCAAASMAYLVGRHFYDRTTCHRLVPTLFVLQCGDPTGTNQGGPGYEYADENLRHGKLPAYDPGDVALANSGPNTNGSQFFFVYGVSADLTGDYPLWGHVTRGLAIVAAIAAGGCAPTCDPNLGGRPKLALTINSARID